MPATAPAPTPNRVAAAAIRRMSHPPANTRESTSRPSASPPRGVPGAGPENGAVTNSVGELGATKGPTTAMATTNAMRLSPTVPRRVRTARDSTESHSWRRRRAIPGGGASMGVPGTAIQPLPRDPAPRRRQQRHDVGQDVHEDIERGQDDDDQLDDGDVPVRDGVDQSLADAREVEDVLDHHDAPGQVQQVEPDHLDRRRDGVRQRMYEQDAPGGKALEPGHLDILALQRLDHRGAHHPKDVGHDHDDQGRYRQH